MERKFKLMVNNPININKTDGKSVRTIASHLLTEHNKRPRHVTLEFQVLVWDRHKNVKPVYVTLAGF